MKAQFRSDTRADTVVTVIQDFTTKLGLFAAEFRERVERIGAEDSIDGPDTSDAALKLLARDILRHRQARQRYFPANLFHEPAWDILLALFIRGSDLPAMTVKALVAHSSAPATTSQRWIDHLYRLRLVNRAIDSVDRRCVEVSLSESGLDAMTQYLQMLAAP